MRPLTFTRYPHARSSNNGVVDIRSWEEWCETFTVHQVRGKPSDTGDRGALDKWKDGPCVIFGEIPVGQGRKDSNVRYVDALSLDLEKIDADKLNAILDLLKPFTFAAWTTHKSGSVVADEQLRLRVVLPLKRSLTPGEFPGAWAGLNKMVMYANDPATKNIGRLNYLPSTFDAEKAVAWVNAGERWIDIADLPDTESTRSAESEVGVDRMVMMRVKDWLQSGHKLPPGARELLAGQPLAKPDSGQRHDTILLLTMRIAARFPMINIDTVEALFGPSIDAMVTQDRSFEGMPSVIAAFEGALDHADEEKKQEAVKQDEEIKQKQLQGDQPYTDDELVAMCESLKCTRQQLDHRWIITGGGGMYWFLGADGTYGTGFKKGEAEIAVVQALKRSPVNIYEATRDGFKWRPFIDICREHATAARQVIPSLIYQRHFYDAHTGIFYEATAPLRKLVPYFDEQIDIYLRKLANTTGGKLIDWLSCVPKVDRLLCSVYFDGPPGAGKSLLAHGLAALWVEEAQPSTVEALVSGFNDELAKCPLIFGDEDLPRPRDRANITGVLRMHLSTQSRKLSVKYRDNSKLMGAIRLILAANNESLLHTDDVATAADLKAIAQRFMYIKADDDVVAYLESLPRETKEYWMREGIAKHVLWLAENHEVKVPGKRFWVEGDMSQMHRILMIGNRWNSFVCEMLVRHLLNPKAYERNNGGLVRRGHGKLLVNTQFFLEQWEVILKNQDKPNTNKIAAALRAVSISPRRIQKLWQGKPVNYYEIDIDHLLAWSDRNNIGSAASILDAIGDRAVAYGEEAELEQTPSANEEPL